MRQARERSKSGIYHVVLRGINRQEIFCDDEDYQHFLEIDEIRRSINRGYIFFDEDFVF